MDSFAQQMLDEIDRRCIEYHLSNTVIRLDNECNEKKNPDECESIHIRGKVSFVSRNFSLILLNY